MEYILVYPHLGPLAYLRLAVNATTNWITPLNYAIAVPLLNNGVFYQFVAELRSPKDTVKHNKAMGEDHVLDSTQMNRGAQSLCLGLQRLESRRWILCPTSLGRKFGVPSQRG